MDRRPESAPAPHKSKVSRRVRLVASILLPISIYVALSAVDLVTLWRSETELAAAFSRSRQRIEALATLRREARQTHIAVLERVLAVPGESAEQKARGLANLREDLDRVLRWANEFEQDPGLAQGERRAARRLTEAIERWAGTAEEAIREGPQVVPLLRAGLAEIDSEARSIFEASSAVGTSADVRYQHVLNRRLVIHVFVQVAVGALLILVMLVWRRAADIKSRLLDSERRRADLHRMASALAHEVNNQLGVLENTVALLGRRKTEPELLAIQSDAAGQIRSLTSNLLALSTAGSGPAEAVDVAELLEHVARPFGESVRVQRSGSAAAVADRSGLARAALNLLKNGLEAGGPVDVTVGPADGGVLLCFADSGPGIKAEHLSSVGEPFFTTKARGTGLGLPIVREFAERSGGRFTLRNRASGGAVAELWVPMAPPRGRDRAPG